MLKTAFSCLLLLLCAFTAQLQADTALTGKVVGVTDGDTIVLLAEGARQHKIRLSGIDAPERRQDFGSRARQFVADLVFAKQVRIVKQTIDRYGRIVGLVYRGDVCVNEELVRHGLAWVYRRYCTVPMCAGWLELEARARDRKMGLWSHPRPTAPWEFRRAGKKQPAYGFPDCRMRSTTWRTSVMHQRPVGFLTAHWHRPALFSARILSRRVDRPCRTISSSISASV